MSERNLTDLTDDEFIGRLAAADPVDPATLPSGTTAEATTLLDGILADAATAPPGRTSRLQASDFAPAQPAGSNDRFGFLTRGRAALVAVAAAVVLLVGGVAVLSPDNTVPALAEVHDAAATTADADTGRITTVFQLGYNDDEVDDAASGEVEVVYSGDDLGISVEIDDLPDLVGEAGPGAEDVLPALEDVRLVDGVAYIQQGGQWIGVDTGGLLGDLVVDYIDPRTVLDTVQELTETEEVGSVDVDGVATTQYRSVVDLGDETLGQSGWLAFDGLNAEVDGEVTIDLYVDDDGLLRRFDLTGQLRSADDEPGQAEFEVVTTFSDLGADLTVEAPADAELFDPMSEMFADEDNN